MKEFQEQYKVDIALFDSTGSTTEKVSPYFDMLGYNRIDFVFQSAVAPALAYSTDHQQFTLRLLQATNNTGGGASAISSATALVGKDATASITTAAKMREAWLRFGTIANDSAITITVGTAAFVSATSGSAASFFACAASDAATVASEGFVAMFNSTANNPSTALTANWVASTDLGGAVVKIAPKNPESTSLINVATTGCSCVSVGGKIMAHIGMAQQFMGEGKRYIAIGVKSTSDPLPYAVTVMRTKDNTPANQTWQASKSISQSTSK